MGKRICHILFAIAPVALLLFMLACPPMAFADELDDAMGKSADLIKQIDESQAAIEDIQVQIDESAAEAEEIQTTLVKLREDRDRAAVALYKADGMAGLVDMFFSASSFDELLHGLAYTEYTAKHAQRLVRNAEDKQSELQDTIAKLDAQKTEQEAAISDMKVKRDELLEKIGDLENANAMIVAKASLFESGDTSGWQTGIASAYGGHSDPTAPVGSHTATGDVVDEYSMGVAVPMAWDDFRGYFGRKVEISYKGQSVIATVNDCGGMGGGSRSLDLQPGVFRAFGCETCDEWGLRTVSFRFL